MTRLRKMMLEELQRRNYSESTIHGYLRTVAEFAKHFEKSLDKLGPDDLGRYQAYLLQGRKLIVGTVVARVTALRFFFVRTLKRHEFRKDLPYPKEQRWLPTDCGNTTLNAWLVKYAWTNQQADSTKTYVALVGDRVAGYYSLTNGRIRSQT